MTSVIRTIYVTESGCDLLAAFPDIADFDRRSRNGASWYDMIYNNPVNTKVPSFKVVVTTNAELAKIREAEMQQIIDDKVEMFISTVRNLPADSRTTTALVDSIVDFISTKCDASIRMRIGDTICEKLVHMNLVAPAEPPLPPSPPETPVFPTVSNHNYYDQYLAATQQTMEMLQTIHSFSLVQMYTPKVQVSPLRKWIQNIAHSLDTSSIKINTKPLLEAKSFKQVSQIPV